jgi:surface antigen
MGFPINAKAALQCVAYAREVSGINLKGDAWQWWNAAEGVYERGRTPKEGAVLVFNRQGSMSHGHVSVINKVVSSRMVLVNHANWAPHHTSGRGQVTTAVPIMDVSTRNDWSEVRVWFGPLNDYGSKTYHTQGFVSRPGPVARPAMVWTETPQTVVKQTEKSGRDSAPITREAAVAPPPRVEPTQPVSAKFEAPQPAAEPAKVAPSRGEKPKSFDPRDWAEQA